MPSSSVPPSNENPVGSFESFHSKTTTDILANNNDESKEDSTNEDATSLTADDQLSSGEDFDAETEEETKEVSTLMANTLLTKVNDRKVTTEKEFHQLLMTTFQRLQDWRSQQSNLISTSDMMLTDWQKSQVDDYISDYVSMIRSNSNKIIGLDDDHEHTQSNKMTPVMIWTLFQILFESSMTGKQESIIGELVFWLNDYFNLDSTTNDKTGHDWESIKRLAMRGEAKAASLILDEIEDDDSDYSSLSNILSDTPSVPTSISISYRKINWAAEWKSWHHNVESAWNQYKETESFNEEDSYSQLMKIVLGDKQAIRQNGTFADKCLATLLYTDPSEHVYNMASIANQVYDPSRDGDSVSISMYNLFTGDYDALLGSLSDNLWLQVHFGHLLLAIGYIPADNSEQHDATFTEEKITEPIYYSLNLYATEIMHKYGMWTEAMQCIMVCRPNTNAWIKKLFGNPPLATEDVNHLKKVLEFCSSHGLPAIEATLYSAIGKRYEASGDFIAATTNYADANDITALDTMARNHLDLYLEKGTLQSVVTDAKYISMTNQSPCYSFYRQYCDLKTNIENKQHDKAYQASIKLLQSLSDATEMYRVVLLIDIFDILKVHRRTNKHDTLIMLQQLGIAITNLDQKSFLEIYYNRCHADLGSPLLLDTVIAKLQERFEYNIIVDTLSLENLHIVSKAD